MIRLCREAGLPEPEFSMSDGFVTTIRRRSRGVAREVTPEVPPKWPPKSPGKSQGKSRGKSQGKSAACRSTA